jgi:hypothetical protein
MLKKYCKTKGIYLKNRTKNVTDVLRKKHNILILQLGSGPHSKSNGTTIPVKICNEQ